MAVDKPSTAQTGGDTITSSKIEAQPVASHHESGDKIVAPSTAPAPVSKWTTKDADAALTLFSDAEELHEEVDPVEEKKLLRRIDFMILPYLAVCYAFFYIDKVGLFFWSSFRSLMISPFRMRLTDGNH